MRALAAGPIIVRMTQPDRSLKVVLVEDRRGVTDARHVGSVRRYRLARLRLDGRSSDPEARFEHLKRVYD
jgi:hypothetical protein